MLRARHRLAFFAGVLAIGAAVALMARLADRVKELKERAAAPDPAPPRRSDPLPALRVDREALGRTTIRIQVVDRRGRPCPGLQVGVGPIQSIGRFRYEAVTSAPAGEATVDFADGLPISGDDARYFPLERTTRDWIVRLLVPSSAPATQPFDPLEPPSAPIVLTLAETASMTVTLVGRDGRRIEHDASVRLLAWSDAGDAQDPGDGRAQADADFDALPLAYEDQLEAAAGRLELAHVEPGLDFWIDGVVLPRERRSVVRGGVRSATRDPLDPSLPGFGRQLAGPTRVGEHLDVAIEVPLGPVHFAGRIVDERGEPLRSTRATVRMPVPDAAPRELEVLTDHDGRFDLPLDVFGALEAGVPAELMLSIGDRLLVIPCIGSTSQDQRTVSFGEIGVAGEEVRASSGD